MDNFWDKGQKSCTKYLEWKLKASERRNTVMLSFKVLTRHVCRETEENQRKHGRTAGLSAEI
jgi:hypothetical protein